MIWDRVLYSFINFIIYFILSLCSVGPQLLYPSPYAVTPPGLMQLHPQSHHHQAGGGGLNSAAASAAVAAAVASGFYDYPTAAYAASQFAANGGFDTSFPFGGAAAAAAAAGKFFHFFTFLLDFLSQLSVLRKCIIFRQWCWAGDRTLPPPLGGLFLASLDSISLS
jgi:hypothetical protein